MVGAGQHCSAPHPSAGLHCSAPRSWAGRIAPPPSVNRSCLPSPLALGAGAAFPELCSHLYKTRRTPCTKSLAAFVQSIANPSVALLEHCGAALLTGFLQSVLHHAAPAPNHEWVDPAHRPTQLRRSRLLRKMIQEILLVGENASQRFQCFRCIKCIPSASPARARNAPPPCWGARHGQCNRPVEFDFPAQETFLLMCVPT